MFFVEKFSKKIRALISHEVNKQLIEHDDSIYLINKGIQNCQLFEIKASALTNETMHSTESGLTIDRLCQNDVIISLTSYGKRLKDVYLPIESIMQGSMKPNKLILWLAEEEKGMPLPITLLKQKTRGLDIRYYKDIKSFKKLIPTLIEYPDACVITIDDDVIYPFDFLENLLLSYKQNPKSVHANRVHRITLDLQGRPLAYSKWESCTTVGNNSILNFATGVGGILYPPHCLDTRVFDEQVFMSLCPSADDIWFFAMAHLKGFYTCKSFTRDAAGNDFVENPSAQDVALKRINKGVNNLNDTQLKLVLNKYNLLLKE